MLDVDEGRGCRWLTDCGVQDERYFESWQARYHDAELDMHAKEEKTEELMDELERRLVLIGASGTSPWSNANSQHQL